ncbi:MAG: hypothetical protein O3C21_13970, partial [Verrucomicrobia bacterium]|nr:hypothetical protein [Verrucomicrobiota bacterium]
PVSPLNSSPKTIISSEAQQSPLVPFAVSRFLHHRESAIDIDLVVLDEASEQTILCLFLLL